MITVSYKGQCKWKQNEYCFPLNAKKKIDNGYLLTQTMMWFV